MKIDKLFDTGLIILDKPPGITSHEITTYVKKICGAKRAGHAGTLDPNVSGVLPIALGRATKLLRYIAGERKTYVGIIKFKEIQSRENIKGLFSKFTGEITQTPPLLSAVRRRPRKRNVYYLKLIEMSKINPRLAVFECEVGAGTYIRTLCTDIGKLCGGARMEELRRVAVGKIKEVTAVTMQELVDAMWLWKSRDNQKLIKGIIQPPEKYIFLPKIFVKETAVKSIRSGAQVMAPAVLTIEREAERGEPVAIYSERDEFLGVGIASMNWHDLEVKKNGLAVKLERVHL
jgi:H/ACA ribonucleoprotein complex subunit 4